MRHQGAARFQEKDGPFGFNGEELCGEPHNKT